MAFTRHIDFNESIIKVTLLVYQHKNPVNLVLISK